MKLFPFYMNVENKVFLVVGGGEVAKRRVRQLEEFCCKIVIVARETEMQEHVIHRRDFRAEDLDGVDYVIAATDRQELNAEIASQCKLKNIPVNVADVPELGTFVFPGLVNRGNLVIGITTSGQSPYYAGILRKQIERVIPDNAGEILEIMGALRKDITKRYPNQADRAKIYRNVLDQLISGELEPDLEHIKTKIKEMS